MSEGFVYILTNEAMPGYVKIGLTTQDDVKTRMQQLHTTGLPLPFELAYSARVADCRRIEKALHFVFDDARTARNREFFRIDPDKARAIIELVALDTQTLSDEDQLISPDDREAIEQVKARREILTFERLGLQPGTVLTFTKDPAVTCVVAGPRKVLFQGQEMSLSAAALRAVQGMGFNWPSARGAEYWAHNGIKLAEIEAG
ncbi:GIY-YIG nuclease family protein [Brevundimonas sp.]|uniref:GIY-YIG nuclease family protein n=1 Tax=Brevundimonas sp. TaxID=1871086 RepID=UPI002618844A|nr:GIY-YIG nuclease family protein [Brevundimonas sp.]